MLTRAFVGERDRMETPTAEPCSASIESAMKNTNNKHRNLRLVLLGLVGIFAVPSVSTATTPVSEVPAPIAATDDDDSDCEPTVVAFEVDTSTGDVYLVNANGGLTLTDNEIDVYFGDLTNVLIDIEYSSGDWAVDITPDGGSTVTRNTRGGSLRYWISDQPEAYVFSSVFNSPMSTMMNMTPVVPDIIIKPKKDCPPPP
jgi:hypothetical protein